MNFAFGGVLSPSIRGGVELSTRTSGRGALTDVGSVGLSGGESEEKECVLAEREIGDGSCEDEDDVEVEEE